MNNKRIIPTASRLSHIAKHPDQEDAYFIALLSEKGKPIAQFGFSLEGWEKFAVRICQQIAIHKNNAGITARS